MATLDVDDLGLEPAGEGDGELGGEGAVLPGAFDGRAEDQRSIPPKSCQ